MKIIKIFKTIIALLLTLSTLFVLLIIVLAKFNNKNIFGELAKEKVIKYPLVVSLFNLNEPGDGRFFYLGSENVPINVEVHFSGGRNPDKNVESWLREIIKETTGRDVKLTVSKNADIENMNSYTNSDLRNLRKNLETLINSPILHIVYISTYRDVPTSVGAVVNRDTIYVFKDTLLELTNDPSIRQALEKSTLMHEWGHLLGLNHNDLVDCIMANKVEIYDKFPLGERIPTQYCPQELLELKQVTLQLD